MSKASQMLKGLLGLSSSVPTEKQIAKVRVVNIARHKVIAARVEVATTSARRSKGLLGRTSLEPGEGLWIVPCESVHTFGMKIALDLIYLDRRHRVRKIRTNVRPWRISACLTAHSVIELAAGSIREEDVQPGDQIELQPVE
ncbi:MAG TPA: DUF192 domain-containing protein [Terracidiphilus sp.]|jgi:hypothetical protein|nr:DUF192 domain-containing protein [Terracidiphilus sp.]